MTDLPSGWALTRLSEICEINPRVDKSAFEPDTVVSFVAMPAVEAETGKIDVSETRTFSQVKQGYTPFKKNDVLFAKITPCMENGKMAIVPEMVGEYGFGSTEFHVLRPAQGVDPKYIYLAVSNQGFRYHAEHKMTGAVGQKRVPASVLEEHELGLPPSDEQRRIVEKIEAMFDEIDKGVENLQTARATLGLYRQSLLTSAFEGRLTAHWRAQNADKLEAPETLLARIQKERDTRYKAALDAWQDALADWRANGETGKKPAKPKRPDEVSSVESSEADEIGQIPSDWAWVRPSLIAEPTPHAIGIGPFGSNLKVSDYRDEGIPLVFVRNITQEDFSLSQKFVSAEKAAELDAHSITAGDVLVTKMGDPPGDCTVYPVHGPYAIITADCLKFRVWDQFADRRFVSFMIRSNAVKRQLGLITQGVAQKKISVARFKTIALPLPSFAEQTEIVRILDARLEAADALEAEINAALTRADALRQSILKKAFSGQLVPQDPNDEPASGLLERIKTDRAGASKKTRRKAPA